MAWTVVYNETAQGDKPIEAFLDALSQGVRAKCLAYISRLESDGTGLPASIAAHVRGKIWELRPEWSGTEYRFFYAALVGQRFVILHAIQKKRQKLRERDIALTEQRYEEIKRRSHNENA
ncbi:MAG: type II toxin-antitoxin system RelE/ParE family toxin [Nitrospira sp.]|nr:type II toxin-antitoxin system RelE/ParE family toxin [Nitrospira sp.]MDH4243720.1 type II toxin-antitoxin system RelE/ParE family toxin [Nitrospira sp.]MDH4355829.1 type II toxin-antitoxin system RelE/ParE family toxin [Nitrospira sp.]MDH5319024.1 type II toxin-antitoxin system RelE/ParE family toxin [Nitrospira sp.]